MGGLGPALLWPWWPWLGPVTRGPRGSRDLCPSEVPPRRVPTGKLRQRALSECVHLSSSQQGWTKPDWTGLGQARGGDSDIPVLGGFLSLAAAPAGGAFWGRGGAWPAPSCGALDQPGRGLRAGQRREGPVRAAARAGSRTPPLLGRLAGRRPVSGCPCALCPPCPLPGSRSGHPPTSLPNRPVRARPGLRGGGQS